MQERNIISATTSMALMPFIEFYQALTPYIILAIVLIIADSRFGVEAAQKRGFAAAGRADNCKRLSLFHGKADVF